MENNKALINVVTNLQIEENTGDKSSANQFEVLVAFIDDLIRNDFNRLLSILYRVDISEQKLKRKLAENKETTVRSAEIIAQLLLDREEEKIISRAKYKQD
ncbi:hypothetical protein [Kaistella jeonii]|uniref:hypothetical protein n=1 Tax=Kaistella jeonii TaxID=266749 RepID=UPI0006899E7E|nr:hypothetical protein [Kaistella jeonii]SFB71715.1 hypothetical protein SAMN05421876_101320 [Kaistella jeonii]VEI94910.1 Uncharacterised protein [Kaistella jeonii]